MTLRDLFTNQSIWTVYGDMDVVNDCIDDCAPAWCGTLLTDEGQKHFDLLLDTYEPLLDTEIEVGKNMCGSFIDCKINDSPDYDKRWNAIKELFECAAGYCSCEDYDRWFSDEPDPVEEPVTIERIKELEGTVRDLECKLAKAIGCIVSPLDKRDALKYIGLSEAEIHNWLDD